MTNEHDSIDINKETSFGTYIGKQAYQHSVMWDGPLQLRNHFPASLLQLTCNQRQTFYGAAA
ncbi:MAG: hypothetical protein ACOYNL_09650 [Rickettsiales bacterium]